MDGKTRHHGRSSIGPQAWSTLPRAAASHSAPASLPPSAYGSSPPSAEELSPPSAEVEVWPREASWSSTHCRLLALSSDDQKSTESGLGLQGSACQKHKWLVSLRRSTSGWLVGWFALKVYLKADQLSRGYMSQAVPAPAWCCKQRQGRHSMPFGGRGNKWAGPPPPQQQQRQRQRRRQLVPHTTAVLTCRRIRWSPRPARQSGWHPRPLPAPAGRLWVRKGRRFRGLQGSTACIVRARAHAAG